MEERQQVKKHHCKSILNKQTLKHTLQITATNQNLTAAEEKQIEDETAGASIHKRNSMNGEQTFPFQKKDEKLSTINKYPVFPEAQQFFAY